MLRFCAVAMLCVWSSFGGLLAGERQPWTRVELPAEAKDKVLRSICFVGETHGWIVGDGGLCLMTEDGGTTWKPQATGSTAILRGVRFNDANHGFVCGDGDEKAPKATGHFVMGRPAKSGTLLATEDGGKTWTTRWIPNSFEIWCVEASAAPVLQVGNGWDVHLDGDIIRSQDGGATWKERRVFRALSDMRAVNKNRWIAVGSPVSVGFTGEIKDPMYKSKACRAIFSNDGGKTWRPSKGSNGKTCMRGLFAGKGLAVAVGDGGAVLRSLDDGLTWEGVDASIPADLRAVARAESGPLVAAGRRGVYAFSADEGKTWKASWVGHDALLYGVAACGETLWTVGEGGAAFRCQAKDLAAAQNLPAPPPEPEAQTPKATEAQRARVRVGDYLVYAMRTQAPAMGMNLEFQLKHTVTAIKGDTYTLSLEVVKGTPPPGQPKKMSLDLHLGGIEDFSTHEINKPKEEKSPQMAVTTERLPNEALEINGKKLDCYVMQIKGVMPGGAGEVQGKQWSCISTDVPLNGLVKSEGEQAMTMPNGAKMKASSKQDLIEWGRGEQASAPADGK